MTAGPLCPSRPQSPVTAAASPREGPGPGTQVTPADGACSSAANTRDTLSSLLAQRAEAGLPPYRPHTPNAGRPAPRHSDPVTAWPLSPHSPDI